MIRKAIEKDLKDILEIHRLAFGEEDEAKLVDNLLKDDSAQPCLSMVAEQDGQIIGHILFTKAGIKGTKLNASLLAPLAVHPDFHFKGTGRRLIKAGFKELADQHVDLVFVLGDPNYYTKSGFSLNAGAQGYPTPVPIPPKWADAWMVRKLSDCEESGQVQVAKEISAPEFWSD
ncbi:N-acetyltransferase [Terasakiella sp. SH-1]|uniref:GNAT family N-acetyltransferase n=1 Tax=Terasakiella sp. SH-1 TaxID=2560057 RepID=UPI001073BEFE|nr:N-acetyltransferase [Terasakiella sp. SH-1]